MADIAAADVTARRLRIAKWGPDSSMPMGKIPIEVTMGVTIDPGTTDAYPTAGIPLTTLFSGSTPNTTPAAGDSGLDPTQLIIYPDAVTVRAAAATYTPNFKGTFQNSAATAAGQLLRLWKPRGSLQASAVTVTGTTYAVASGTITDSGSGFVTAGFRVGDVLVIAGFTGTAANNTMVVITGVAAGTLTVAPVGAFTNDAAGESVTLTAYRSGQGDDEFTNIDVTGPTLFNGDTDPYFEVTLRGFLRENLNPKDFGIIGA